MPPNSSSAASTSFRNAVGLLLAVAAAGFSLAKLAAMPGSSSQRVAAPFTLQTKTLSYEGDPRGRLAHRHTTARRSDGTTVEIHTFNPGMPGERRMRVIRYLDGRSVQLVDALAAKTTWPKPPAIVSARNRDRILHPPMDCVFGKSEIFLRHDTLFGQRLAVVSMSFIDTVWRAPELGCQVIQSRSGYKHEGVFKLQSETKPVRLRLGEPDPRLFDEGADYAELKPSELLRRTVAKAGIPWDASLQQDAELLDKKFFGKR